MRDIWQLTQFLYDLVKVCPVQAASAEDAARLWRLSEQMTGLANQGDINQADINQAGINQAGINQAGINQASINQAGTNQAGINPTSAPLIIQPIQDT